VSLPEGEETYHPRAGERVFADRPETIEEAPAELAGLVGIRAWQGVLQRAQSQSFGGYPIPFKAAKEVRLFAAFAGEPPSGWGRYAANGLAVGGKRYSICARDYPAGEGTLLFPRGPVPILLGFKERSAGDPELDLPTLRIGDRTVRDEALRRDFVTILAPSEFYQPRVKERVYTDRQYAIERIPKELESCIGIRYSNERAKAGDMAIPFRLERPATLYVVFGGPDEGAWEKPQPGWRLYAAGGYQHGPGDEAPRSIYCKEFPAGDGAFVFTTGTGVALGFK